MNSSVPNFYLGIGYLEGVLETRIRPWQVWLRLRAWLSLADSPCNSDLIFVLAGGMDRKEYALELFRQGAAPRILLSVGRFEIRRFSKMPLPVALDLLKMAQAVPPPKRHYFVDFQADVVGVEYVRPGRLGTLTEINALARWLSARLQVRSVLVVSNATHLRRIRICCHSILCPDLEMTFVPAPNLSPESPQEAPHGSLRNDLLELFKLCGYWFFLRTRGHRIF